MISGPRAGAVRPAVLFLVVAGGAFLALVAYILLSRRDDSTRGDSGVGKSALSQAGWEQTSDGDFEERIADMTGSRIRLRAATRRTSSAVKFMGVRRRQEIELKPGTKIAVDLDWNRQPNGSGLAAGILFSPSVTPANPYKLSDYLWVEYIGVPPGRTARRVIGVRLNSNHRHLDSEGWPEIKSGRPISVQRLEIEIGPDRSFRLTENGLQAYASPPGTVPFERAFVYLELSSHTNFPPREVFFDNFSVTQPR